ncbi:hypothetical protein Trydic_g8058 [Trypoxylus dichotomus]
MLGSIIDLSSHVRLAWCKEHLSDERRFSLCQHDGRTRVHRRPEKTIGWPSTLNFSTAYSTYDWYNGLVRHQFCFHVADTASNYEVNIILKGSADHCKRDILPK